MKTTRMPSKKIKFFIRDESDASKTYAHLGKKYHDHILTHMAADEARHRKYWVRICREKGVCK